MQDICIGTHMAVCFAAFLRFTHIWHFSPGYPSPAPAPPHCPSPLPPNRPQCLVIYCFLVSRLCYCCLISQCTYPFRVLSLKHHFPLISEELWGKSKKKVIHFQMHNSFWSRNSLFSLLFVLLFSLFSH